MIDSARPTVSPVANIVFALFCYARFWKVGTDGRTDGRQGLPVEWINKKTIWLDFMGDFQMEKQTRMRAVYKDLGEDNDILCQKFAYCLFHS